MATFAADVGVPFRFSEDCDLYVDEDEAIIDQALNLITFTPQGTVPLASTFGSQAELSVFDQLDSSTELILDTSLRNAFESQEPRAVLDKEFKFDESADQKKLVVIVPYRVSVTGKLFATRLVIGKLLGP